MSHDTIVGPPRRAQWIGGPRYSRHHDHMSSVSAVVSSGGRIFYIRDEASCVSILVPPEWFLIARDAFNGTILWKRRIDGWHTHLWPLKSGPAVLPRRLVANGDRVYATLGLDAPLAALDAATGETVRIYEETRATEEVILSDGVLFLVVNRHAGRPGFADKERISRAFNGPYWDESPRRIMALSAEGGEVLWSVERPILPATLAADHRRVFFHDGRSVVCLDRFTGKECWRSDPLQRSEIIRSFYLPILVVYGDAVLFSGGETAGMQRGAWYTSGEDTMIALSVETGEPLWSAYHPPSGYRSPEDLLVADGLVWTGETTSGRVEGVFTGRDPLTGEIASEFLPDVDIYWFHHRCYRGKATDRYLIVSRAGTEFIDIREKRWLPNHWVRGACLYGIMPANGLLYAPPHPCACYLEAKMSGFCALAPSEAGSAAGRRNDPGERLGRGPAYKDQADQGSGYGKEADWPMYRHDPARSGVTASSLPDRLEPIFRAALGGRLTPPVVAGGRLYVACVDSHTMHALDAGTGEHRWRFTAGGRIDSPPVVFDGRVYFGSADGWVYSLRSGDGALAWRFRAGPEDRRLMAHGQVESLWPVHGSVMILDGSRTDSKEDELWFAAGRSMFLDGGLCLWRLDPGTGRVLSRTVLDGQEGESGLGLQGHVSWLNMPAALPDILSTNGRFVYMRSQPFRMDGTRPPYEPIPRAEDADQGAVTPTQDPGHAHLFCPTGFLDDSGWHRTYWLYGSQFVSGWAGYYLAGKTTPAGRLLVFDASKVYGFGRKPQYYDWTTPIEHHLFAAPRLGTGPEKTAGAGAEESLIRIQKSKSLDLTGQPLTVEAQVQAGGPDGVIFAGGGEQHGLALYLLEGRPHFALRIDGRQVVVHAEEALGSGRFTHLAGVLTREREVRLYVDGEAAASADAKGFLAKVPVEALAVGADEETNVGDYTSPFPFKGVIDEVRVYHRALDPSAIRRHAAAGEKTPVEREGLVLWYAFEEGDARDASNLGNHGEAEGLVPVRGKVGVALRFSGKVRPRKDFMVLHDWTLDLPLLARAMVKAEDTLLVAGPPDLIDEEEAFRHIDEREVQRQLSEQAAAIRAERGAILMALSAADGQVLERYDLNSPPVFDGMIAAGGRLYVALEDGSVICFGKSAE